MIRENGDYKQKIETLEKTIEVMKGELFKKKKVVTQNETEKFIINQQVETMKRTYDDERKQYQVEIEDLQAENLRLKTKLEELNEDLENMEDNNFSNRGSLNFGALMDGYEEADYAEDETLASLDKSANIEENLSNRNTDRRQSMSKDQIVKKLTLFLDRENGIDLGEDETDPNEEKKKIEAEHKEIQDEQQKRLNKMRELTNSLQTQLSEETKKCELLKKHIDRKETELEILRNKLIEKSMSYSTTINDMNEELEKAYEDKRKIDKQHRILLARQPKRNTVKGKIFNMLK